MPTRVLDVDVSSKSQVHPHLTNGQIGEWVALSYCWGKASGLVLRAESFERLTRGVELEDLSATHRDAVMVTRALGLRYLWLDALCIFQDSDED